MAALALIICCHAVWVLPNSFELHGPETDQLKRLAVGESVVVQVNSRCKWNRSGVLLERGAHYQFTVFDQDRWCDARIRCGADGWTACEMRPILRPAVRALEGKRRCPSADWFELIGSVSGAKIRIGKRGDGWSFSPGCQGEFLAFANDLDSKYGNNRGSIRLAITRVAAQASKLYPTCCDCR